MTSWIMRSGSSVAVFFVLIAFTVRAEQLGTAFTYQGQLKQSGVPADGVFDMRFTLWDSEVDGQLLSTNTVEARPVEGGLFAVRLDFGAYVFDGRAWWIEVSVARHEPASEYTTLNPRQRLTPAPYALALPGLRTEQNSDCPNLIGGWAQNYVMEGVVGATVSGGGGFISEPASNRVADNYGAVGGGAANVAGNGDEFAGNAAFATVAGGSWNTASGGYATVAGGGGNYAAGEYTTVGGGYFNVAINPYATVSGGTQNAAGADGAAVGGGRGNTSGGESATVPGGSSNTAGGDFSLAAGRRAVVRDGVASGDANGDEGTFVWADSTNADFMSTGPNQFLIRASGGVGIGTNSPANALSVAGDASFSGTVGIGTTTPMSDLDVVSEDPLSTTINVVNTSASQRYLLQVNGNAPGGQDREGNLEIVAFGPDHVYSALTATPDGRVGVNTANPRNAFSVDGVADFNGLVGIGTATPTANLDVVSAHPSGTAIDIRNDDSAQRYLLQVNGTNPGEPTRAGNFEIWGTGSSGNLSLFTATRDGRIGIGTTSPGYSVPSTKLEVTGGHIALSNNYGIFSSNSAGDGIGAGFDTGHDGTLDLYAGGGKKMRITPAGRAGIGTDTPTSTLSVAGGADFSEKVRIGTAALDYTLTNTALEVSEGNITLGNAGGVVSVNGAGTGIGAGFRTGTSGDLYVYSGGAVRAHFMPDGKVGIGSSPPSDRLTVGGIVKSTTGGFKCPDGSILASADGANIWSKNGTSVYYNGGAVGIGTSNPQDEIDILNGDITMDTGASGSNALRFRYDGAMRWTFLYRSWATNEFGLYNESAGKWGITFRTDTNNVGIGRADAAHPLHVGTDSTNGNGAHVTAGGVWTNGSDRNSKRDFEPIDAAAILQKVVDLPLSRWQYKAEAEGVRHIGPMAQDFYAAFELGESDKYIGTIDADGVALAALQGLHAQLRQKEQDIDALRTEKDAQIAAHEAQIAELTRRLQRLEALVE